MVFLLLLNLKYYSRHKTHFTILFTHIFASCYFIYFYDLVVLHSPSAFIIMRINTQVMDSATFDNDFLLLDTSNFMKQVDCEQLLPFSAAPSISLH